MAEYALLFLFTRTTVARTAPGRRWRPTRLTGAAAVAVLTYAATDEWHQTFVPGRGGTVVDVVIDASGILLVAFFLHLYLRRRAGKNSEAFETQDYGEEVRVSV